MTEQQFTGSINLSTTIMYFAYPDDDLTKPGRPVPGAYFNLGNIWFEVLQVDAPRREGDKYIYPVHLLQIHDPNNR